MHNITITNNTIVAKDIHKITAKVDPKRPIHFKSGQFCMVHIPKTDGSTIPRAYSFANPSHDANNIIFYVKILRDTEPHYASPYFEKCKPGDELAIDHPAGHMTLPEIIPSKLVYIATTTGIAPYLSHLQELSQKSPELHVDVIFGCRNEEDIFAQDELTSLKARMPNLNIITTISQPNEGYNGNIGRVTEYLDTYDTADNTMFYLCGNKFMIIDARKLLINKKIDPSRIKFEIFY